MLGVSHHEINCLAEKVHIIFITVGFGDVKDAPLFPVSFTKHLTQQNVFLAVICYHFRLVPFPFVHYIYADNLGIPGYSCGK